MQLSDFGNLRFAVFSGRHLWCSRNRWEAVIFAFRGKGEFLPVKRVRFVRKIFILVIFLALKHVFKEDKIINSKFWTNILKLNPNEMNFHKGQNIKPQFFLLLWLVSHIYFSTSIYSNGVMMHYITRSTGLPIFRIFLSI